MTKNNRKKAIAQAISTVVALGWVIMQVESAQAATLTVNNLDDSGFGSLRDAINTATSNDVVEFLLGSNPSTITLTSGALAIAKNLTINGPGANLLTISSNNNFPVFDINAANVTLSGLAIAGDISRLAIAGNINAYNFSNLTFTNSTINGHNLNIDSNLTLINSTINSQNLEINGGLTGINDSNVTALSKITIGGNLSSPSGNLTISTNSLYINGGNIINLEAGGKITVTTKSLVITGGSQVTIPNSTSGNSGQINGGSNSSGAGGNITLIASDILLRRVPEPSASADDSNHSGAGGNITISVPNGFIISTVPEPSAIAGNILAGSLAWLAKRKQAAFRKAKV
ncbi:MAG: hypothetical protein V7K89_33025 [Nostoc sp.]|uniref:hypothetical protein n=1 Tax=Nostoc sp. TaxID=1180 RepID=UPI002FFBF13E